MPRRVALVLLSALLTGSLAACGSTVSGAAGAAAAGGSGVSGALPSGSGDLGSAASQSGALGRGSLTGGGLTGPNGAPGGVGPAGLAVATTAAGGGNPASTVPVAADGPGVTPTTITVGVAYYQNANAANDAIGGKGIEVSDPTATAKAIIAAVNRSGGIAGRRVLPLFFSVDPQSATPYANEAQAECSYFTEDHKVFAVVDGTQAVGTLARPCFEQHHVAFLSDNSVVVSDLVAHEVDPDSILFGRLFASLVPSLSRQSWFSPWNRATGGPGATRAKTGILTADRPALNRAVDDVLVPLLRRAGYAPDPADIIRITAPGGFGDDGATVAAIDNAVLRFNADGVDHVILTDSNGSISLLFNNYAYSQHYLPRYGGSTGNFWQSLLTAGDIQAQTLQGALGIGWMPVVDLPYHSGDGAYPTSGRRRCLQIMSASGQAPTSATVAASELVACDAFFVLQSALSNVRDPVNVTVLLERIAALGGSFSPALSLGDQFSSVQRDGPSAGYDLSFGSGCGCFGYTGPSRQLAAG